MFTGIVEDRGVIAGVSGGPDGARLEVTTRLAADVEIGDSVAVNGTCLTVVTRSAGTCGFDVVPETLNRTNLGELRPGDMVNLERPMPADGRFDGHIVQGHIDGLGVVSSVMDEGEGRRIAVAIDDRLSRYLVEKGSVTIDGVSLTVAAARSDGFDVALIPHTLEVTNLDRLRPGTSVNLEVDVIAKYVERLVGSGL